MYATDYTNYNYGMNMYANDGMFVDTCNVSEPQSITTDFDDYSSLVLTYLGSEAYQELVNNHAQELQTQNSNQLQAVAEYYSMYPNEYVEDDYAINMYLLHHSETSLANRDVTHAPAQLAQQAQVSVAPSLTVKTPCPTTSPEYKPIDIIDIKSQSNGQVFFDSSTTVNQPYESCKNDLPPTQGIELSMQPALPTDTSVGKGGNMQQDVEETSETESSKSYSSLANPELPNLTHEEAQHSINIAVASTVLLFHLQDEVAKNDRVNVHRKMVEQILDGDLHTARYIAQWLQEFDRIAQGLTNNHEAIKRCFHTTLMQQVLEQKDLNKINFQVDPILNNPLEFLEEIEQACYSANYGIALLEEVLSSLKANKQREAVRKISSIATKLTGFNFADESSLKEIASICNDTQTIITKSVSNNLSLGSLKTRLLTSKMQEAQERPFTFGLPAFDRVLSNGWRAGELMVIGAAPGIGKTALALNLVMSRAVELRKTGNENKKILFFSLELTDLHVMDRLLKIQLNQLAIQAGNSQDEWNNFAQVVSTRDKSELALCERLSEELESNSSIYIVSELKTIEEIAHFVASTKARGVDIDFIVIDYLQNCRSSNPRYEVDKLGLTNHVSHTLTEIAKRNQTRVCALGLLRDGKFDHKNPPTGADLKESRQIEADADIIVTLTKEIGGNFNTVQDCLTCIRHNVANGQQYANALGFMLQYSQDNTGYSYTIPSSIPRLDTIHVYIAKYRNGTACATSKIGFIGSLLSVCELASNAAMYQHRAQPVNAFVKTGKKNTNFKNQNPKTPASFPQGQVTEANISDCPVNGQSDNLRWWR